jgi:hypothetical protein
MNEHGTKPGPFKRVSSGSEDSDPAGHSAFAMSGIMKVIHAPGAFQGFAHMGIPEGAILPFGILELSCLALDLIPQP